MNALVWTAPFAAEMRAEPRPSPMASEVLLAVRAVGVCGSDLHGYRGASPLRIPPLVLGHEVVGEDDDGRLHVINPLAGCGRCALCREGAPNLCPDRTLLGLNRPGAFAELVSVPAESMLPLPASMSPVLGTLVEPLATSINALRGTTIGAGTTVVILGCGPIGLLAAHAVRAAGAGLVVCHDVDTRRVAFASISADVAEVSWPTVEHLVREATNGHGAAIVIDAVGIEETWTKAVGLARPGGLVLEIGLAQASGSFPVGDLVRRGVTVRGVYAYTPLDFADALSMIETSPPPLEWVETVALARGVETLAALARGEGPVKAVFEP